MIIHQTPPAARLVAFAVTPTARSMTHRNSTRTLVTFAGQAYPRATGASSRASTSKVKLVAPTLVRSRGYATVSEQSKPSKEAPPQLTPSPTPTDASGKPSELFQIEKKRDSYTMDHHIYKPEDLDHIQVLHHEPKGLSDRVAALAVKVMRSGFDIATRYPGKKSQQYTVSKEREADVVKVSANEIAARKHKNTEEVQPVPKEMPLAEMRKKGLAFGPEQWLIRCIFLESVAGVPGMVAGTCRHLHSLRLLRRDRGWITTCLEDAENERMHLLTFLAIRQPGLFMRAMLLATQGIFYNFLFLAYLMSPRTVHRFVGNLEEEAVYTYTRLVEDIEQGRLPEWENVEAPEIGKEYWKLPKGQDKLIDLIKVIRADEAGHRFIHHTLADLDQKADTNPFSVATPTPRTIGSKLYLTREESLAFIQQAREGEESPRENQATEQAKTQ